MSPIAVTTEGRFPFSPRPNRAHEIRWHEWSPEAFDLARASGQPVLLNLVAAWSSQSQQMDDGVFSQQRVLDLVADHFVPIRVDADERPDVEARYGLGSLPTTAFLTPDGDPIASVAGASVDDFVADAEAALADWTSRREELLQRADAARATRAAERATAGAMRTDGVLTPGVLDAALEVLAARWSDDPPGLRGPSLEDVDRGGTDPRGDDAPEEGIHPDAIRLWRYAYHRRGLASEFNRAFALARQAIDGPLFDSIDGGLFHCADPVADVICPEKLARDQGAMLLALSEVALSDEEAREDLSPAIAEIAGYLTSVLGDFSGAIFVAESAGEDGIDLDAGAAHGGVDRRVFTAPAAIAARGLLSAGTLLNRPDWVERGRRAVDFLMMHLRAGEAGMYHAWDEGGPRSLGFLDDQAQALLALLTCYEVTGQTSYFEYARRIARLVERDWHEPAFGFSDVAPGHEETGLLVEPVFPLDGNVAMAEAFLWIGRLTHDERYLAIAQETLSTFAHGFEARGLAVASYARVVDRLLSAEPEFKVVAEYPAGDPDSIADPLHHAALRLALAGRTVQRMDRAGDSDLMRQLGLPDVAKVAYVCIGGTCSAALTDPAQLLPAFEELQDPPER